MNNPSLTQHELNWAVQETIDRIVFLRICEDRGIENYGRLRAAAAGRDVYPSLVALFGQADDKYNSGLFHFSSEPHRDPPDNLTPALTVADGLLEDCSPVSTTPTAHTSSQFFRRTFLAKCTSGSWGR